MSLGRLVLPQAAVRKLSLALKYGKCGGLCVVPVSYQLIHSYFEVLRRFFGTADPQAELPLFSKFRSASFRLWDALSVHKFPKKS
jgi:hypothetical protein